MITLSGLISYNTAAHKAMSSTLSNTFGMNWNTACEPDLITNISVCIKSVLDAKNIRTIDYSFD